MNICDLVEIQMKNSDSLYCLLCTCDCVLHVSAEAFVGKDKYLKRLRIHGKGKAGRMVHPRCRLTVILKELSPEKEAELARLRVQKLHGKQLYAANAKLVPHRVVQTQWQWSRKPSNRTLSPA